MRVQDFCITSGKDETTINLIGIKQIIFSNDFLHNCNPHDFFHSQAIPFYSNCGEIKGSRLILKVSNNISDAKVIDLLE
jgi:hypothetical protein